METDHLAQAFIIGAILALLFIVGILFLIIYGLIKQRKSFWITGIIIAAISIFIYMFTYFSRYKAAINVEQEARERMNSK